MRALIDCNSVLYQSTDARSNGVTPSARLPISWTSLSVLYISLLLFFDPDVFYNPENENELLASMDIYHPVRIRGKQTINNTVIESEVSREDSD